MFGRRSQRDFEDEIRSHIALEAERLRARGMSAADANYAARRAFGNIGVAEDRFYHAQRFSGMQNAGRDLRHAWRALRRHPSFVVTSIVTLALTMGSVTGMFSVVKKVILDPLPFEHSQRLIHVTGSSPGSDLPEHFGLNNAFYLQFKERSTLAEGIFIFDAGTSTLRTVDRVERVRMAWPSNDIFATLGVRPQLGRLPVAEDGNRAIVISDELWSTWFGRDSSVIGKSYFVSEDMKEVIGVLPPGVSFPENNTLLWVSGEIRPEDVRPDQFNRRIIVRMKPGVSPGQLANELTRIGKEVPARFGGSPAFARLMVNFRSNVEPLLDSMVGPSTRTSLWVLLSAVLIVLLIACSNVASLFLVRAESRARDMALRRAIGATRLQLVRLQLAEAALIALGGGTLAIILSRLSLPVFLRAAPDRIPRLGLATIDGWSIAAAAGLVVIVAISCGLGPALRASSPDLRRLREGGRGATGGRHWGRDLLVAGQAALALVLLIGSALLIQSFTKLRHVDPGYEVADLYTFQYAPDQPALNNGGPREWGALHDRAMERLRAIPGVSEVGAVNNVPLDEEAVGIRAHTEQSTGNDEGVLVQANFAGGDYFQAMGIELLRGRTLSREELLTPQTSVVVSRSAAAQLWPGRDPLGQRVKPSFGRGEQPWFTVVGVVDDVKQRDWREASDATLYFSLVGATDTGWTMSSPAYVVKSNRADLLRDEVRAVIRDIAPEAPVYREYTMEFLADRSMIQLSFTMLTLGVVSALALLLGALGLYGVLSCVVAERTREIGVRMALGATGREVRRQIVSQGARVVLGGVLVGLVAAAASSRLIQTLLYEVKAVAPVVYLAMGAAMMLVGVVASYVPARRASHVDPMISLRSD